LAKRSPVLIESMMMQFFVFATFNSFWTVIVLHLTAEPYGWNVLQAGLFGFVGIAAAVVTPVFGRLIDRFGPLPVIGVSLGVLLIACLSAVFDAYLVGLFAGTLFLVTLANQSVQAANQSRVLVANPHNAAQANTLFIVGVFMGGSTGAIVGRLRTRWERCPRSPSLPASWSLPVLSRGPLPARNRSAGIGGASHAISRSLPARVDNRTHSPSIRVPRLAARHA
jgi:MFS family permease